MNRVALGSFDIVLHYGICIRFVSLFVRCRVRCGVAMRAGALLYGLISLPCALGLLQCVLGLLQCVLGLLPSVFVVACRPCAECAVSFSLLNVFSVFGLVLAMRLLVVVVSLFL